MNYNIFMPINKLPLLPNKVEELALDFCKIIKLPAAKSPRPIIVGPFGPCLIGKTTTMRRLAQKLPFVHIEHDRIRRFLTENEMGGNEQKKILYDYLFIVHIARYFLEKGYSVIVDRSFSTGHKRFLTVLEQEAKERKTKFFLIRIKAPKRFILRKIKNLKPTSEEKYLPDKKTGVDCYLYALKNYKKFYDALKPRALAVINTSKPISPQFKKALPILKKEMGI